MIHLRTTTEIGGWLYHVRLYSVPNADGQTALGYTPGLMETHYALLPAATNFDGDLITEGGLASLRKAVDGEMLQGTPTYENQKISLTADPVFQSIVNDALRDLFTEVWLEVVVEFPNLSAPALKPGEMYWPRKKRLYYWGKALKRECQGDVQLQSAEGVNAAWRRQLARHNGTIELSFIHWLKVRGAKSARTFLDFYTGSVGMVSHVQISELLYSLVQTINPTQLFAVTDWKNVHPLAAFDSPTSVAQCNFNLARIAVGGTQQLAQVWIPRTVGGVSSPLFDNDESPNAMSLYNLKDCTEFLVALSEEFDLKFQIELPTLDEAGTVAGMGITTNPPFIRKTHWEACSRWKFAPADLWLSEVYPDPENGSIKYTPSATWISSCQCDLPQPSAAKVSYVAGGEIELEPKYGLVDFGVDPESENKLTIKSLFRFVAYYKDPKTGIVYDPRGVELYFGTAIGSLSLAAGGTIYTETGNINCDNWGQLRAWLQMLRWGSGRATVEFEQHLIGLEPFGLAASQTGNVRGTFGLMDIGDFPLLRTFEMDPGILHNNGTIGTFAVYDITMQPGGNASIKAIEIGTNGTIDSSFGSNSPDPDPPALIDPPTITFNNPTNGSTVTGIVSVKVTSAVDTDTSIDYLKFYANSALQDMLSAPAAGLTTFFWDTTHLANAAYTLKAELRDMAGSTVTASISVTVSNPP